MNYPFQIAGDRQRRFSLVHYTIRRSGSRLSWQRAKPVRRLIGFKILAAETDKKLHADHPPTF
jgi:hypothetical protein